MKCDQPLVIAFVFVVLFGFVLGLYVASSSLEQEKETAIAAGCAQYNPKTGKFEWLKP